MSTKLDAEAISNFESFICDSKQEIGEKWFLLDLDNTKKRLFELLDANKYKYLSLLNQAKLCNRDVF